VRSAGWMGEGQGGGRGGGGAAVGGKREYLSATEGYQRDSLASFARCDSWVDGEGRGGPGRAGGGKGGGEQAAVRGREEYLSATEGFWYYQRDRVASFARCG